MVEGIGPKSGVVGETVGEQLEGLLEKSFPSPPSFSFLIRNAILSRAIRFMLWSRRYWITSFSVPFWETHAQEVSSCLLSFSTTLKTKGLPPARRPCSLATWTG